MDVTSPQSESAASVAPQWQPLSAKQRRVVGVLIEKAKTTPEVYPLTLNALVTGCNQKSNRSPVVNYTATDVQDALEELRKLGAVSEVISEGGRVPRYKHRMYEWLGVTKEELAVMAELLLRGEQTLGELRSHVSRMEPVADLATLKGIVDRLIAKKLVTTLTPAGRGQVVCHMLYKDHELQGLRQRYAGGDISTQPPASTATSGFESHAPTNRGETVAEVATDQTARGVTADMFAELQVEVAQLQAELAQLRQRIDALEQAVGSSGPLPQHTQHQLFAEKD